MRQLSAGPHGLTELHLTADPAARRAAFRRAVADLAAVSADRPMPLEGLDPEALQRSLHCALEAGLLDELSFLSAPAAAVALCQMASGLRRCAERQALEAKVRQRLLDGDASTFVAAATALAVGSSQALAQPALRTRASLAVGLPIGASPRVDALALALCSRSSHQQTWVVRHATGSLPSRRLAARLLERAAREATRRAQLGDEGFIELFKGEAIQRSWERLLYDRESLVWRHVASARGLLATSLPEMAGAIEGELSPGLSPTEWRRGAASLVASIAVQPERAVARCMALLDEAPAQQDQGLPGAMLFGAARALEAEPQTALSLVKELLARGGGYAAETLLEVLHEQQDLPALQQLARTTAAGLKSQAATDQGGRATLGAMLARDLDHAQGCAGELEQHVLAAQRAFASEGCRQAVEHGRKAVACARAMVAQLERRSIEDPIALSLLHQLDRALLQSATLSDVLRVAESDDGIVAQLNQTMVDLLGWLLHQESQALPKEADPSFHMRGLVALLHLLDREQDGSSGGTDDAALEHRLQTVRTLLRRLPHDTGTALGRVVCASLARAIDALIRDRALERSDVLWTISALSGDPSNLTTLAEASMDPPLERALFALRDLVDATAKEVGDPRAALDALDAMHRALPVSASPRQEALRLTLLDLALALECLNAVPSLSALRSGRGREALRTLERATQAAAQLAAGAHARLLGGARPAALEVGHCVRALALSFERPPEDRSAAALDALYDETDQRLTAELPPPLARLCSRALLSLRALPEQAAAGRPQDPPRKRTAKRLPDWVPVSRTLGGFHLLETLGEGAVGTVFVATRTEARDNPRAPRFALKTPEYDGRAARSLSEDEFLRLFRQEAGALLALPDDHPHLAGFVTFDARAQPKPILVMELVEGASLARVLERGTLSLDDSLDILDGVAAGLCAMHEQGLGHLDLKPGNVVLREQAAGRSQPVLVDFGLSGRRLRPGCATTNYGAPEIWGLLPDPSYDAPLPADVYAFGCLAFEVLTGQTLFTAPNEMSLISAHIAHDGSPEPLALLRGDSRLHPLADWIGSALRRDPRERTPIERLRQELSVLRPRLGELRWPLGIKAA